MSEAPHSTDTIREFLPGTLNDLAGSSALASPPSGQMQLNVHI